MAAPSPAQTPGAPIRGGALAGLKKIPTPFWLIGGGAGIGLIYTLVTRGRGMVAETDLEYTEEGTIPEDQLSGAASPVAYVTTAAPASEPAETVGAVGQTALETITGAFTSILVPLIERDRQLQPTQTIPVATPPPGQAPTTRPTPNSKPILPAGYQRSSTAYGKRFPGAVGWARIGSGGKGREHWIDIHVRYATSLQRWRYWPNRKPKVWKKTYQAAKPPLPRG